MKACHLSPAALALFLATACESPPPVSQGKAGVAMPTLASTPDVRTEAEAKAAKKRKAAAEKAAREQKAAQQKALAEAGK